MVLSESTRQVQPEAARAYRGLSGPPFVKASLCFWKQTQEGQVWEWKPDQSGLLWGPVPLSPNCLSSSSSLNVHPFLVSDFPHLLP